VQEDNQKFQFDNDIYSQEFFDFVKGILEAVKESIGKSSDPIMDNVKTLSLQVGKKAILDILAKCYHNSSLKQMIEVLSDLMKKDETLSHAFLL
jgi:hypothetical protein